MIMNRKEKKAYDEALKKIRECDRNGKTEFRLSGMGLNALPPEIGQLTALTDLDVYDNQLSSLPSEIGQLTALTTLNVQGNQLSSLPPEIGQLSALRGLYFEGNQLSSLPPEIGQLTALVELAVGENPLETLPDELQRCQLLQKVYLRRSQLRQLPVWLRNLPKLTHLNLAGCEHLALPPEIAGPDTLDWGEPNAQRVLNYYFSRQEQGELILRNLRRLLHRRVGCSNFHSRAR